ncbi:imprinted and ancient [Collybia nuda]|uniref:Imprinted and ancient n=1 Tax=Collybia nuda TaxID=64659 RepID=A0A9P5Y1Z3_9AGAR|nr:imprinted and ancient [Collybia nuda]
MPSSSPPSNGPSDLRGELALVIAELLERPDRESVASELQVLQSIYGDDAIRLWHPPAKESNHLRHVDSRDEGTLRYEAELSLPSPHDEITVRVLVSIPPTYPVSSPPQLQLLSRYIGAFGADSALFGSVLRTFISVNGVEWAPDTVCVFDGLTSVIERCTTWYEEHLTAEKAGELVREDAKAQPESERIEKIEHSPSPEDIITINTLPEGLELFTAEAITDRKSAFVGRACRITHPSQASRRLVLSYLMTDRRISRAAHPIINAWRCQIGTLIHQDNDDDGETAAGGRLAHLLQILEVNNVLVIVTRYFGGIHLGPDRFKHINQAARNALDLGGFLDAPETKRSLGRGQRH